LRWEWTDLGIVFALGRASSHLSSEVGGRHIHLGVFFRSLGACVSQDSLDRRSFLNDVDGFVVIKLNHVIISVVLLLLLVFSQLLLLLLLR
jgi:hypothetical protein